eukprot:2273333-Amphidinium_carterae.2
MAAYSIHNVITKGTSSTWHKDGQRRGPGLQQPPPQPVQYCKAGTPTCTLSLTSTCRSNSHSTRTGSSVQT